MTEPSPILITGDLFRALHGHLLALLDGLAPGDWQRPTVCSLWCVKDIAAHLLDGDLRRLSMQRDGYVSPRAPRGFDSPGALLDYLHRLNADWTRAADRLSPRVLTALLAASGAEAAALFDAVDPFGPATFPVAWAGESSSPMWFDVAREYTERWHHQRQIALAVGRETPIDARRFYHPVLDTFLRALPFTYRGVAAPTGASVRVKIVGEAGGSWRLRRGEDGWALGLDDGGDADAAVVIPQGVAWRLFTKRTDRQTALARFPEVRVEGDAELGGHVLEMVSIMA